MTRWLQSPCFGAIAAPTQLLGAERLVRLSRTTVRLRAGRCDSRPTMASSNSLRHQLLREPHVPVDGLVQLLDPHVLVRRVGHADGAWTIGGGRPQDGSMEMSVVNANAAVSKPGTTSRRTGGLRGEQRRLAACYRLGCAEARASPILSCAWRWG